MGVGGGGGVGVGWLVEQLGGEGGVVVVEGARQSTPKNTSPVHVHTLTYAGADMQHYTQGLDFMPEHTQAHMGKYKRV